MQTKKLFSTKGITLVELLIYVALLSSVLVVLYQFFTQVSYSKISQITQAAVDSNGRRALFDFQQTIKTATTIDQPVLGETSSTLSLNSGQITYSVDGQGRLVKIEGAETNFITDQKVVIENLNFTTLGPSTTFPTIKISFDLKSLILSEGRAKQDSFQTAVTLR